MSQNSHKYGVAMYVPTVWLCGHPAEPVLAKNESGRVDLGVQKVVAHGGDPTVRTCLCVQLTQELFWST